MEPANTTLVLKLAPNFRYNSLLFTRIFCSLLGTSLSQQPSKELKAGEGDSCCWHCPKHVGQPASVEAEHAFTLVDLLADEAKTIEGSQASDMHLGAHHLMRVCDAGSNSLYTTQ